MILKPLDGKSVKITLDDHEMDNRVDDDIKDYSIESSYQKYADKH